jgi:hypothetical protein
VRYYGQAKVQVAERQGALQLVHVNLAAVVRVDHIKELRSYRQLSSARRELPLNQDNKSVIAVRA